MLSPPPSGGSEKVPQKDEKMPIQDALVEIDLLISSLKDLYGSLKETEYDVKEDWASSSINREKEIFDKIKELIGHKEKIILSQLPSEQKEFFKPPEIIYQDKIVEKVKVIPTISKFALLCTFTFGIYIGVLTMLFSEKISWYNVQIQWHNTIQWLLQQADFISLW